MAGAWQCPTCGMPACDCPRVDPDELTRLRDELARYKAFVAAWDDMDAIETCFMDEECTAADVIEARQQFRAARAALPDNAGE